MSEKFRKTSENMSFSLSRRLRKFYQNAPTAFIVTFVGMAYTIFLFGGGLYMLINNPITAYSTSSGVVYFLYPDISNQFVGDTFIAVTLYALGFFGMLAIYQSTKSAYKPKQAYMLLVVGVTFLLISYIFLEGAINFKQNPT
jgi:hypothetical protein